MTSGTRIDRHQHDDGPFPGSRWMTADEYDEAYSLALLLTQDTVEGVSMRLDPEWPEWRLIEVPCLDKPDRHILISLPVADGEWGLARTSAFFVMVAAQPGRDARQRP
jgi:hypothetical protein